MDERQMCRNCVPRASCLRLPCTPALAWAALSVQSVSKHAAPPKLFNTVHAKPTSAERPYGRIAIARRAFYNIL